MYPEYITDNSEISNEEWAQLLRIAQNIKGLETSIGYVYAMYENDQYQLIGDSYK